MATALLQSTSGTTATAKDGNNLFQLACNNSWNGKSIQLNEECFRHYSSASESFLDFYQFLSSGPYPPDNHTINKHDILGWANLIGMSAISNETIFQNCLIKPFSFTA